MDQTNWGTISAYNHDCEDGRRCAKIHLDPKLKFFDKCFGGENSKMGFSDVDGTFERNGLILWMEWKSPSAPLLKAQFIMLKAFYANSWKQTPIVVWGDPKEMTCERLAVIEATDSIIPEGTPCTMDELLRLMCDWYKRADEYRGAP